MPIRKIDFEGILKSRKARDRFREAASYIADYLLTLDTFLTIAIGHHHSRTV